MPTQEDQHESGEILNEFINTEENDDGAEMRRKVTKKTTYKIDEVSSKIDEGCLESGDHSPHAKIEEAIAPHRPGTKERWWPDRKLQNSRAYGGQATAPHDHFSPIKASKRRPLTSIRTLSPAS